MNDHEPHHGKAMIITDKEHATVELVMECVSCGKFSIVVPLIHMRSSLKILEQVADALELPEETHVSEVQSITEVDSREEAQRIAQEFERMSMEPPWLREDEKPPSGSAWD